MKRVGIAVVVLCCAALAFAEGQGEAAKTAAPQTGPLEFSILHMQSFVQNPSSDYLKKAFEKLNVKVSFVNCDGSQSEQVNLTLASGTIPDVMLLGLLAGVTLDKLVDQDILRELPEAFSRRYAPWMSSLLDRVEPAGWGKTVYQGKQYGLPLTFEETAIPMKAGIRKDWLDKVGVKLGPTITIDELENAFRKFVTEDPDGNGKADTYAMTSFGGIHEWQLALLFGAYGVRPSQNFSVSDGKAVYSPAQPGYKEALKNLAKWYKAGYIDPEWVTESGATATEKFGTGKVGYFGGTISQFDTDILGSSYAPAFKLKQVNPSATIQVISEIKGLGGVSGTYSMDAVAGWYLVLGKQVTDEKAAAILHFYDDVNQNIDKWLIMEFGFEGENYYMTNGMAKQTQAQLDLSKKLKDERIGQPGCFRIPVRDIARGRLTWGPYLDVYNSLPSAPKIAINFVPDWPTQTAKDYFGDIQKTSSTFAVNAISGKLDIDKEWDAYIASLRKLNLATIETQYNDRYQQFLAYGKK